ncbi:MAG: tetratricopeptide repeat protein [Gemmatimonadota bacterium]
MSGLKQLIQEIHRRSIWQVLAIYLVASWVVFEVVQTLTEGLGLPDWVPPFAFVLLLIGFPIVLATAFVQEGGPVVSRAEARLPEEEPALEVATAEATAARPEGAQRLFTWRNAILGGLLAFALLGVVTTGYMGMRLMGIGPLGSLVAAGVLEAREPIILADFDDHTGDPELAVVVTEAFRIDLAQSPIVMVVPPNRLADALRRMEVEPGTPIDRELGRELAIREGIKAVIRGEIGSVGPSFALLAELIAAESGETLAAVRETARDSAAIMGAIDRLSKKLRERVGESLKTIRSNEPLDRVTTSSLDALLKYSEAVRALDVVGDHAKGIALLEEAIALDTTFAMAYRKLGKALYLGDRQRAFEVLTRAFEYRDQLTDPERFLTAAFYYDYVRFDWERAITWYNRLLETYPDDYRALLELAGIYDVRRDYERAAELLRRGTEADSFTAVCYPCLTRLLVALGRFEDAEANLERFARNVPGNPQVGVFRARLASAQGDYEGAAAHVRALRESQSGSLSWRVRTSRELAKLAAVRGRLGEAERHLRDAMTANEQRGSPWGYVSTAADLGVLHAWLRRDADGGLQQVEAALDRYPLDSMTPFERPYLSLAVFYATAERSDLARATLEEFEMAIAPELRQFEEPVRRAARGAVYLADGNASEAIAELRRADELESCWMCLLPDLGRAYDLAGQADSALAIYGRYLERPWITRLDVDVYFLAMVYERLGALYEERGNTEKATYYYGKLVELWKGADPELQPRVEAARRTISALSPDR